MRYNVPSLLKRSGASAQHWVERMDLLARNTSPLENRNAVSEARWLQLFRDCSSCEMITEGREFGVCEVKECIQ